MRKVTAVLAGAAAVLGLAAGPVHAAGPSAARADGMPTYTCDVVEAIHLATIAAAGSGNCVASRLRSGG
ncbi:hypothetical protein AB0L06_40560 [Spirillospora sp. NPDC052269]